ncbi:MAG: nucleoside phosphorylase [Lactobacillales bacterium]|jgi:purine-nucleoside phosphorylase|nr:nucleoside phosphorylase [Lactobacillales bacterium]
MILEEFDSAEGLISPWHTDAHLTVDKLPEIAILPFSGVIIEELLKSPNFKEVGHLKSINGTQPIYIYKDGDAEYTVKLAEVGAPNTVATLEELMASGVEKVIIFGSCGALDKNLPAHQVIVPTSAVRDEGTSYHYAAPSDEIIIRPESVELMSQLFKKARVEFALAKAWTTDAFFRETLEKTRKRIKTGCQVVDMEASAVAAWAQYRDVDTYHFFYTADHVDIEAEDWDARYEERNAGTPVDSFFQLALYIAQHI